MVGVAALAVLSTACGGAQQPSDFTEVEAMRERTGAEPLAEGEAEETTRRAIRVEDLEPPPGERLRVDASNAPSRGADEPLVTIVMFSDFECPFCARAEPTLDRLLASFPDDVRIVWRNLPLPFHRNAMLAAEAAMEAYAQGGDDLFWRYHALLFENQRALSRADLERYGALVGMNVAELSRALDDRRHRAAVEADSALAARLGARGTPAFFLNGRVLMGAQPYHVFEALVFEEMATARAALERGLPREALYDYFMHGARAQAPPRERPTEQRARRPTPDPNAVYRIPVDGRPARGRADALVTIVMFADYECPFSARVQSTLDEVASRYGDELRFVFRHHPLSFHENAMPAAVAAEEVFRQRGAEAFFRYSELLFQNHRNLDRATLLDLAAQVGANRREVTRALARRRHRDVIAADQELARTVGATGTPAFYINGRNLRGAQPFATFQTLIEEELERARARVEAGTPRGRLYESIIADGATTPQLIGGGRPAEPDPMHVVHSIPEPEGARTRGPDNARVTIQVFSDFQCPFCSRLGPTLEQILRDYPRDVRVVFRDYPLPFHENAMPAAQAAREAFRQGGNDAFWRYHDLLFENQRSLDVDTLVRLAGRVPGVNAEEVRRALERETHREAVLADMQAITDAGLRIGTPSSFVNGRLLQGAQSYESFRIIIERALNEP